MIKEVKKYYSDIDSSFEFYEMGNAEKFERTYKPFYELNDEAEAMYDRIRIDGDPMLNPYEVGKELFDKAKVLLVEYVKTEMQSEHKYISENDAEELCGIEYNKKDLHYVTCTFSGDDDYEWKIISYVFDIIYWFLVMK